VTAPASVGVNSKVASPEPVVDPETIEPHCKEACDDIAAHDKPSQGM